MAIRDILAQLDVRVEGASSVAQMNAALDKTVAQVAPAGRAFENMRIRGAERAQRGGAAHRRDPQAGAGGGRERCAARRAAAQARPHRGGRAALRPARGAAPRDADPGVRFDRRPHRRARPRDRGARGRGRGDRDRARAAIGNLVDAFREVVELGDNLDKTAPADRAHDGAAPDLALHRRPRGRRRAGDGPELHALAARGVRGVARQPHVRPRVRPPRRERARCGRRAVERRRAHARDGARHVGAGERDREGRARAAGHGPERRAPPPDAQPRRRGPRRDGRAGARAGRRLVGGRRRGVCGRAGFNDGLPPSR